MNKIFTNEEFKELRQLSHYIRHYESFRDYCVLDIALAHKMGGSEWEDDRWILEGVLQNLDRLLLEKGPRPTEENLRDYIDSHRGDIRYIPEVMKKTFLKIF